MSVFVFFAITAVLFAAVIGIAVARGLRRLQIVTGEVRWRIAEARTRFLPPGPRRDAALLRRRLQGELHATRDMLAAAPDGLIFRADARTVLGELATAAAALDRDLGAVERFLDPAEQRAALATLGPQAEQVIATTYTARQTVLRTAAEDRIRRLNALQADVAQQAAALEIYRDLDREPHI